MNSGIVEICFGGVESLFTSNLTNDESYMVNNLRGYQSHDEYAGPSPAQQAKRAKVARYLKSIGKAVNVKCFAYKG